MGRRMSVTEIWARMEPSINSTREWTVDWGWMVTRTLSGGRSKRRQASMTSKPLFIMVAESMVMRWPMTQVGCLRAWAGVMWAKSAAGVLRKGPPEAVSQIWATSRGAPPRMALVDGVVFAVDGEEGYVVGAGGGDDEVAGGDEALLVGEADGFAGEDGGVGGLEAGDADDGGDDEVDVGVGGDGDGAGGAVQDFDAGDAGFAQAEFEGFGEGLGGEGDELGAPGLGLGERRVYIGAGCKGDGGVAVWELLADGEGALADGAGGAQDCDFLH